MPSSSMKPRRSLIVQSVLGELERYLEENEAQLEEKKAQLEENGAQLEENRVFHAPFAE